MQQINEGFWGNLIIPGVIDQDTEPVLNENVKVYLVTPQGYTKPITATTDGDGTLTIPIDQNDCFILAVNCSYKIKAFRVSDAERLFFQLTTGEIYNCIELPTGPKECFNESQDLTLAPQVDISTCNTECL